MKKANEGCEGQTKARGWPKTKFQNFLSFFGFLGSLLLHDFHIFEFEGTLLAGAAFFHLRKFKLSKQVL